MRTTCHRRADRLLRLMSDSQLRYVVLTPAQRSGSTLMQRLLNTNPETIVWGEHGGALKHLVAAYWQLAAFADSDAGGHRKRLMSESRASEWTANASPHASVAWHATVDAARALLESLYCHSPVPGVKAVGFKEVQYGAQEITLIQAAFPNSEIILLVRDPVSTLQAVANQRWSVDQLLARWTTNVLGYLDCLQRFENVRLFRYEDLAAARPETISALAQLAEVGEGDIRNVLGKRIAGPPGYANPERARVSREAMFSAEHTCRPIMDQIQKIAPSGRPTGQSG